MQLMELMDSKADAEAFFDLAKHAYLASQGRSATKRSDILSESPSVLLRYDNGSITARIVGWAEDRHYSTLHELVRCELFDAKDFGKAMRSQLRSLLFQIVGDIPLNTVIAQSAVRKNLMHGGILWWSQAKEAQLRSVTPESRFAVMWLRRYVNKNWDSPPDGSAQLVKLSHKLELEISSWKAAHAENRYHLGHGKVHEVLEYREGHLVAAVAITKSGKHIDITQA